MRIITLFYAPLIAFMMPRCDDACYAMRRCFLPFALTRDYADALMQAID